MYEIVWSCPGGGDSRCGVQTTVPSQFSSYLTDQFVLLLLPEVNRTTLRLFGTLMMKEIFQTMSTVHPAEPCGQGHYGRHPTHKSAFHAARLTERRVKRRKSRGKLRPC